MNYYIYADVSIDIDMEVAKENDIRFVPMEYMLGDEAFNCAKPESDETLHNYYEKLQRKVPTKTSQITPNSYVEIFEPAVRAGIPILYLALSSGLSDTYSSARMAVQMLQEDYDNVCIEVVDSYGATGGMGLLAEAAAENRKKGMSVSENAAWLRAHTRNVLYWFKVEDLMYLMRGGRVSATTAIVGTALNIKPILTVNHEGKLDTIDKKRGNKLAVKNLIERFEASYDPALGTTAYICCSDCIPEAEKLRDLLLEKHPELTVRITMLSPIIGAHTGPDMFALIHWGNGR